MADVQELRVPTKLGRLRVQVRGDGDAVLFWPSLLMTGDMWVGQMREFEPDHRVIVVDPPGHGGSEKLTAPFSFTDCAATVADILDSVGVERTHFVGNSWGGMIGGTFAALHPDRIGRAVLMNCTASPAGRGQKLEYGLLLRMAKALRGIRGPLTRPVLAAFLGPTTFDTRPEVVAFVRDAVHRVDVDSAAWAVTSVVPRRPDQRALFSRVKAPVLVVAGAEDATFPLTETIAMADAIPGADVTVLDGVAHLAALENPRLVNTLIRDFLARG